MRDLKIVCVGKIKENYFNEGISLYEQAIRRSVPFAILECPDEPTPDKASPALEEEIRTKEGRRILQKIREDDYVIALCIDGKEYDSPAWKNHLKKLMGRVTGSLVFVIGGSLGLSQEVVRRADERLSFSSMTFPHQMMRMILCEQIARVLQ
ncbi:MAG: 23S rRNA (pseudouridine(1915)-N(3))-methyltransferase RlmH [Eubacterium sp.]|nr:23S rRNA (pseudouridine(1915)-N(3))-methyltransferase RlmH [Eubacterium sp.]